MRVRDLSFDERARWGKCPVCDQEDGEPCLSFVGIALGRNINGETPPGGAHLGRLQRAPFKVQEIGIR